MSSAPQFDFAAGETLLFDKPKTWTSFDVVAKVRNLSRERKIGHAGTLDPLATGLLILCTGKKTKTIDQIQGQEKEYLVHFALGATTPSYDAEFPPENLRDASHITRESLLQAMKTFTGEITQVPPMYSAVKVNGQRAYEAARKQQTLELKSRQVFIYAFELEQMEGPGHITARVRCSKGTYIRSLVHDLGQHLGVGAYMTDLRRTAIGAYRVEDAWTLETFAEALKAWRQAQEAGA